MAFAISDKIYKYCTNAVSVSSNLAKDPFLEPAKLEDKLYGGERTAITERKAHSRQPASAAELQRARECGNWGNSEPSELY